MKRSSVYTILALLFVSFASLGATECSDEHRMLWQRLVETLSDHEQRIEALERCDCTGFLAPVCGEDGRTYVNRCEARCAGEPIASLGVCEDNSCGGEAGVDSCDDGSFCEIRPGCDEMAIGMCEEIPDICPDVFDPVCGCDGSTYGNDCERRAAGVPLDFRADCANPPVACDSIDDCAGDDYCRKRPGVCDVGAGVCGPLPDACPTNVMPVCGCDDNSYVNACAAAAMGVNVASEGRCKPDPVECSSEADCGDDEFCATRRGECGTTGVCAPVPDVCPQIFAPVCGCDGETYPNRCVAAEAGVSVEHGGKCEREIPICHFPPGNPGNFHTILVEEEDVRAHLMNHGDHRGPCRGDEGDDSDSDTDHRGYRWSRPSAKSAY